MHDEQRPPSASLGKGGCSRSRSRTLGQRPRPIGGPQHDRRASLRHHQILDGGDALQDANSEKGGDGDGASCPCLQHDPRHEHHGRSSDDRGHEGVKGLIRLQSSIETSGCPRCRHDRPHNPSEQSCRRFCAEIMVNVKNGPRHYIQQSFHTASPQTVNSPIS
jgi:hypothetical protein